MEFLELIKIKKSYNNVNALSETNIKVKKGEFLVLVGPSGCGKSTLLRAIAGLEKPTGGEIYLDNKMINNVEPGDRDIAMVFQNYALYPHMKVFDNLSFALKLRKFSKDKILKRVEFAAKLLGISKLLKRYPRELSGGERQRVAVGRAIVRKPKLFLFDEPLSNLDAKLRIQMRVEISRIHKKLNATMIYVTHDQTEAMTMGDRIVVMEAIHGKGGVIKQIGSPMELYNKPRNSFVAGFIGSPATNFIDNIYINENKEIEFNEFQGILSEKFTVSSKENIIVGVRPEKINISKNKDQGTEMVVELIERMGFESIIYLVKNKLRLVAKYYQKIDFNEGDKVYISIKKENILIFSKRTGAVII